MDIAMAGQPLQIHQEQGRHDMQAENRDPLGEQQIAGLMQFLDDLPQQGASMRHSMTLLLQTLPKCHLPGLGGMIGGPFSHIPAGEHIRTPKLVLVEDIGQLAGELEAFEPRIFSLDISLQGKEDLLVHLPQQGLNPPGQNPPVITVRVYMQPQPPCDISKEIQRQQILKITPAPEGGSHGLGDHPLHPLALDQEDLFFKQTPPLTHPDHLG